MRPALNRPLVAWFLAGCGLVAATQAGYLSARVWNPTALLQVGAECPARPVLEGELGPLALAPGLGHDGKYFYLIARRPWPAGADPATLAGLQDPGYRYARPLYPLVSGLGGTLPPRATLAGLVVVQVLAGGLYAAALVALARHNGLPTAAVLVGLANPTLYSSAVLLTSDLLASALVLGGVHSWQRGRVRGAVALLAAALLAKEYYALTPLALAVSELAAGRRRPGLAVGVVPLLPVAGWKMVVFASVGVGEGAGNFTWPGRGVRGAVPIWWQHDDLLGVVAVALVVLGLVAVVRAADRLVRSQCAGWAALGGTASPLVWADPADLLRVVAPLWWFVTWGLCPRPPAAGSTPFTHSPGVGPA